ncbi:uncharacterized protein LOC122498188 isoform X2 [Leptopilina heterotoma]|uniref:uncharacterized protein LOC122498188 isoform X2 n=1 Tax=Leptopilina heterotoma TaxID=63436 RepID=UPI001CA88246|nr:uncharacterized protein LOC122498188 isoform X2 [Leptopilina heterotoma]
MSESINSKTNLDTNVNNRKKPRLEKLAVPRKRIDNSVKPGALTYEISENVNKLAQPKLRNLSDKFQYSSSSFFSMTPFLKPENLVKESPIMNSANEESTSQKQNIETYAKITARRKSVYLKRLHHFSKPMKKPQEPGFGSFNSENNFSQLLKNFPGRKKL